MEEDEELEEQSNWEKQLESEKKSRNLYEGNPYRFQEIPDRLDPLDALWYYNTMPDRQEEIYHNFLSKLKTMREWLEIYVESTENMASKDLAFAKLSELDLTLEEIIELHETRYHDERIVALIVKRIDEYAGSDYKRWLLVYDSAPFESKIRVQAMKRLRWLAKTLNEWQELYDRNDIGSANQILALQNILLLSRFERKESKRKSDENLMQEAALKGSDEWRELYETKDFYSKESDNAVVNIYLSAQFKAEQGGDKQ